MPSHDDIHDVAGLAASLDAALAGVFAELGVEGPPAAAELGVPSRREHGDLTTNAALVNAKRAGRPPREIAQALGERWCAGAGAGSCARFEVAGPGFLNLFLTDAWHRGALARMLAAGSAYGRGALPVERRQKVNIEFVSVNPTGPLHVGHARYASYGDALCRIFAYAGHDVTREFYVNDAGTQMLRFGQSLAARYAQRLGADVAVPDDGYQGEYVLELADEFIAEAGERYLEAVAGAPDALSLPADVVAAFKTWGRDAVLELFRATLGRLRVPFDVWAHESGLYAGGEPYRGFAGEVGKALADLDAEDLLYEHEGAVWLKTTRFGDDKDRVLIRSSGEATYFLSDIAYHRDKMDRGFEHMIDIWGADHHGYVPRMKAAFTALPPHRPERLELIIGQLVNLLEGGAAKRMSKRRGDIVTVDDLVEAIGVDAARFLLVGRSQDTTLELDLDLAVEQSSQNPVYYVQYAHARICSVLRTLVERGGEGAVALVDEVATGARGLPDVVVGPEERDLIHTLARFPDVVLAAVEHRAPHRVHTYLGELAAGFHVFYRQCRVIVDDPEVSAFRVGLCRASQRILATGLDLLGVSAPEQM
ncbi:MAG TPA: arginine--tRNA ligase [Thermoleophilia bacterium]|nr:arginine--tRNA ligase [Thermoleophilia bacterium]